MIAALFVQEDGCYSGIRDVQAWGVSRDARAYSGPWPVVAHPPCERWGGYAAGGPSNHGKFTPGDDGGCFEAALGAVRRFGGVLEHPAKSLAFSRFNLGKPGPYWSPSDDGIGFICEVEQFAYGHPCRKKTWLYAAHVFLPDLRFGDSVGPEPESPFDPSVMTFQKPPKDAGPEWREERRRWYKWREEATGRRLTTPELLSKARRAATPVEFRDVLLAIAGTSLVRVPVRPPSSRSD